jgi:GxxExxY protein
LREESQELPASLNALSQSIIGGAIEVHKELGPGLLEKLYEEALVHELELAGHTVERQVPVCLRYKGRDLLGQRPDLVVDTTIVVELKAIERVLEVHGAQLLGYLRAGRYPLGLLINFNVPLLHQGVHRRINSKVLASFSTQSESSSASSANSLRPLRTSSSHDNQ